MTYKHYILANRIKDSMEAYVEYLEKYYTMWEAMPTGMKVQFAKMSYHYRFSIQWK